MSSAEEKYSSSSIDSFFLSYIPLTAGIYFNSVLLIVKALKQVEVNDKTLKKDFCTTKKRKEIFDSFEKVVTEEQRKILESQNRVAESFSVVPQVFHRLLLHNANSAVEISTNILISNQWLFGGRGGGGGGGGGGGSKDHLFVPTNPAQYSQYVSRLNQLVIQSKIIDIDFRDKSEKEISPSSQPASKQKIQDLIKQVARERKQDRIFFPYILGSHLGDCIVTLQLLVLTHTLIHAASEFVSSFPPEESSLPPFLSAQGLLAFLRDQSAQLRVELTAALQKLKRFLASLQLHRSRRLQRFQENDLERMFSPQNDLPIPPPAQEAVRKIASTIAAVLGNGKWGASSRDFGAGGGAQEGGSAGGDDYKPFENVPIEHAEQILKSLGLYGSSSSQEEGIEPSEVSEDGPPVFSDLQFAMSVKAAILETVINNVKSIQAQLRPNNNN